MTNSTITLEGTQEQVLFLEEAVDTYRAILMRFRGTGSARIDNFIAERDDAMAYWQGLIRTRK